MPDPSARYGSPFTRKESEAGPVDKLKAMFRGLAGNGVPGADPVAAAKKRSQQRAAPVNKAPGVDDIVSLQNMLGAFGGVDPDQLAQLQSELRQAIAGQFDPQIANAQKDISSAKSRASGAKKDIGALYDELVGYYQGQVAPTKERGESSKKQAAANSNALRESITDDYATRIREQVDEFKRLGIQAAVPSATEDQNADMANQLAIAENTRAAQEAAIDTQSDADLAYWTEGSGIAKREGTEQQAVITQQLNDFLNDQSKQIALLRGQKSAAYHTGLMELQQQAAQAASQQQNELWDRMMQLAQFKLSAAKAGGAGGLEDPGRGLTGALGFLGQTGRADLGDTFQQYLAESQRWATTPQARAMYGGAVDTPEEWAQVMRDNAANKRLGQSDQTALWQAALRYFGRG